MQLTQLSAVAMFRRLHARFVLALGLAILALTAAPSAQTAAPQAAIPPELALDRTLPVDPAVKTGRLPNGLRYFIRQNARPANRVSMRLAVNAGAIQEDPDQRGLAHFLEHMAFNGTENFKPGELVSFLESIGARFGPHVNASTSFDETIYMLDIPTDRAGLCRSRHAGAARFRRRHLAAARRSREGTRRRPRGVARPARRRLAPDRQAAAGDLPGLALCRAAADRPARGAQERAARAAARVLPEVVSPRSDGRGRGRRHPGGRGREAGASSTSAAFPRRRARWPPSTPACPRTRRRWSTCRPIRRRRAGRCRSASRARPSTTRRCGGYRKTLVGEPGVADVQPAPARHRASPERAVPRRAGRHQRHRPHARAVRDRSRRCRRARSPRASAR